MTPAWSTLNHWSLTKIPNAWIWALNTELTCSDLDTLLQSLQDSKPTVLPLTIFDLGCFLYSTELALSWCGTEANLNGVQSSWRLSTSTPSTHHQLHVQQYPPCCTAWLLGMEDHGQVILARLPKHDTVSGEDRKGLSASALKLAGKGKWHGESMELGGAGMRVASTVILGWYSRILTVQYCSSQQNHHMFLVSQQYCTIE